MYRAKSLYHRIRYSVSEGLGAVLYNSAEIIWNARADIKMATPYLDFEFGGTWRLEMIGWSIIKRCMKGDEWQGNQFISQRNRGKRGTVQDNNISLFALVKYALVIKIKFTRVEFVRDEQYRNRVTSASLDGRHELFDRLH